jgi:hypothetical protein
VFLNFVFFTTVMKAIHSLLILNFPLNYQLTSFQAVFALFVNESS